MYISIERLKGYWFRFYKQYEFGGILLLGLSVLMIVASCIISYRFITTIQPLLDLATPEDKLDVSATGMIGDFIGGVVGPILSFVGVLLFFLALRLQSKELGLQIKELSETRNVFTTQQFENTFFNLLQTQQEIRMNLEVEDKSLPSDDDEGIASDMAAFFISNDTEGRVVKSAAVFELIKKRIFSKYRITSKLYNELKALLTQSGLPVSIKEAEEKKKIAELRRFAGVKDYTILDKQGNIQKSAYKEVYEIYSNQLGHYFRNLYHILSYLRENEQVEIHQARESLNYHPKYLSNRMDSNSKQEMKLMLEETKIKMRHRKYAAFVQAQMSSAELFLLFYNALFFPKMKALIHYYDFLENLNVDDLLDPERDKLFYGKFKYGGVSYKAVTLKSGEELLKIY